MAGRHEPSPGVRLRPEDDADLPFLLALYRSTREHELAAVEWTNDQKHAFVVMQFQAQREHYRREYQGASFDVIERNGVPIGRLYVHERPGEIRIMDITLAPQMRSRGIGSALLRDVLDEGARSQRPVTIHVERFNPARHLYERLGFHMVGQPAEDSIYLLMEALPPHRSG